ncbi:MAG: DEAD/DEAH box helicase [Chloroflexi bacterium]|nr:DEAD/DEAH box helicase [Chloroflexota bacterium]
MDNPGTIPAAPPPQPLPETTLERLPHALRQAAARTGWDSLVPVQARAIPYLLAGRNMMIQARTGSGKTGAFLLPMLERLDPAKPACQALILVPTRELARQVWQEAEKICGAEGLRATAVYGGVGYGAQIEALRKGAQVVVGTPGRALDHLLKRALSLENLKMLVYDEADRMLSMGFYPDMQALQRYLPRRPIHTCMFSATFPDSVLYTARQFIQSPEFISLSADHLHVSETEHVFYVVPGMDKDRCLVRLIETENPASALIFCNTKTRVHYVAVVLQRFGYDADELSADLSQSERERALERVRGGTLRLLVATDVAARGLDIPSLSHVFLYEPPEEAEAYIHRAGRTGRAGASGVAISLVNKVEKFALEKIGRDFKIPFEERPIPTDEDVAALVAERMTALLEARLRQRDKLQTERSRRFTSLARSLAESEDELPIITMLLDESYQQSLHAPVVVQAEGEKPAAERPKPAGRKWGRGRRRR